jgi:hypothetical protein
LLPERGPVLDIFNLDRVTIIAHVFAPAATATSGRIPVDCDQWFSSIFGNRLGCACWTAGTKQQHGEQG